ncbi:MAG: S41 family peptidase, partial [Planctomycetota bacterium]
IVFSYANDLWIVSREGGTARPLAGPQGQELNPRFSPDGKTIAFMGNYEGGRDLYTIPVAGGMAQRVTHHPAGETLSDWSPDGNLLFFASGMSSMPRASQIFSVSPEGGLPEMLPVPYGTYCSISDDGKWLAYTPYSRETRTWKRYRGGMATDVWLFNLENYESKKITDWEGTDAIPMWHGNAVYYLSDAGPNARLNIWKYDVDSGKRTQITKFKDYDVKWPAMGPGTNGKGELVFQNGANLYLCNLDGSKLRKVDVTIPGDRPTLRPNRVNAANFMQSWDISPTGKRAVVQARGDVWTLPAEKGTPRNLTRTSGHAERTPTWSPDGRWIAYFSDATGEYELYVTQSDGKGETKQLTEDSEHFYEGIWWSPDSEHILVRDKGHHLHLITVETGEMKHVDHGIRGSSMSPSWSHDSSWIAYHRAGEDMPNSAIFLYDVTNGDSHQVTSGMFSDYNAAFDHEGNWLYYASRRSFRPTYGDVDQNWTYRDSGVLIAVPLRDDVEHPWTLETDEETWDDETAEDGDEGDSNGDADDSNAESSDDAAPADAISGTWSGMATAPTGEGIPWTMNLELTSGDSVVGTLAAMGMESDVTGSFDSESGMLTLAATLRDTDAVVLFDLSVEDNTMTGTAAVDGQEFEIEGSREASSAASDDDDDDDDENGEENGDTDSDDSDADDEEEKEPLKIDLENFEMRAMQLPTPRGNYGTIAVNNKNHVIYSRDGSIRVFDISQKENPQEKTVTGGGGFAISADGKKMLVGRGGRNADILNTSPGGSSQRVVTDSMYVVIDRRAEWEQILNDAWRIMRDYFYVDNMHGVDWEQIREDHLAMLKDAVSREDVSFIIGEMIAELNVGHAYYWGGDGESQPSMNVGLLGVDFAVDNGAYKIEKIYEGASWDTDARSPFTTAGTDVKEGDYLLAVNGIEITTDRDPWAPFVGMANRVVTLTVSEHPEMDENAREVVVRTIGGEGGLRYRHWIEQNRKYVEEKTDGKIGYIYVPDTGVGGQTDLVRQYYGQID